jgi:hypothetical protein
MNSAGQIIVSWLYLPFWQYQRHSSSCLNVENLEPDIQRSGSTISSLACVSSHGIRLALSHPPSAMVSYNAPLCKFVHLPGSDLLTNTAIG